MAQPCPYNPSSDANPLKTTNPQKPMTWHSHVPTTSQAMPIPSKPSTHEKPMTWHSHVPTIRQPTTTSLPRPPLGAENLRRNVFFTIFVHHSHTVPMKIKKIDIRLFRGLKEVALKDLDPKVNLFVGINGAGKSSILDAMSIVFTWYVARMSSSKNRGANIAKDDISNFSSGDCCLMLDVDGAGSWELYRSRSYQKKGKSALSSLNNFVSRLREQMDNTPGADIPLVVHYGVNRLVPDSYPRLKNDRTEYSQLDALRNAMTASLSFADLFKWFRASEDYENEMYRAGHSFRDRGLDAVRRALEAILPDYHDLKVTRRPLALTMKKGNDTFRLNQLSDGEKCYIALVCDIARRLSIANPEGDPLQGRGIVLIDEIELHLHPKWQQTVVSRLTHTFPNCQFFITTHSPIVASDTNGKVYAVKNGEVVPQQTFGKLSSSILSSVFDISMARSLYVQSLIDNAYAAIANRREDEYRRLLQELAGILGADDPDITGLKIEKMRRDKNRGQQ